MKRLIVLFISLYLFTIAFGQKTFETNLIEVRGEMPTTWQIYLEEHTFKIEYKFLECDPEIGYNTEYCFLKFTNLTNNKLNFSYHLHMYYAAECKTCDYPEEYTYSFDLAPNSSYEGTCSLRSLSDAKIFSKFTDKSKQHSQRLTAFKLNELTVVYSPKDYE